jgi:hypothetical protein
VRSYARLSRLRTDSLYILERNLTLSWPDKPFRLRSRVIQFRPGIEGSSAHLGGSKDVLGDIGVRTRGVRVPITWQSVALRDAASVESTIPELYQR